MSQFTRQSNFDIVGNSIDPDVIYYNASIVNNNTDDSASQIPASDPQITFNETRANPIVRDASKYQFSIIRFVMNGANKDLPLFIPSIQSSTGQTDVDLTEYGVGIAFDGAIGGTNYNFAPPITYAKFVPEVQNTALAPTPRTMANANYVPTFVGGVDVGWVPTKTYYTPDIVYYTPNGLYYEAIGGFTYIGAPNLNKQPDINPDYWKVTSGELGQPQDLSTRYYWVSTYSHWVDIINTTFVTANTALWTAFNAVAALAASYPTYASWIVDYPAPIMKFDPLTGLFSIYYPASYTPAGNAGLRTYLYFNNNMEGLFSNFDNIYLNQPVHPAPYNWVNPTIPPTPFPFNYANLQIVRSVGLNDNVSTPTPPISTYLGAWTVMTQDYISTSSLWSPIDSIVFTTNLLPIQNEETAQPNALGTRNTGNSSATSKAAFTPIITDVALDLALDPAGYRKMIYYSPAAEYRMADFQNSKQEIRNIDIKVFWKNRLDNNLYPVNMYNLSSVSFKMMFRKK